MDKDRLFITGKVTDEYGSPLLGVNVVIKDTLQGTSTDNLGVYKLNVPIGSVLVFSFVGRKTKESTPVKKDTKGFNLVLEESVEQLPGITVTPKDHPTKKEPAKEAPKRNDFTKYLPKPKGTVKSQESNNQNLKNAKMLLLGGLALLVGIAIWYLDNSQVKKTVRKVTV